MTDKDKNSLGPKKRPGTNYNDALVGLIVILRELIESRTIHMSVSEDVEDLKSLQLFTLNNLILRQGDYQILCNSLAIPFSPCIKAITNELHRKWDDNLNYSRSEIDVVAELRTLEIIYKCFQIELNDNDYDYIRRRIKRMYNREKSSVITESKISDAFNSVLNTRFKNRSMKMRLIKSYNRLGNNYIGPI